MKPFKEVIDGIRKAIMASEVREDIAQMGEYVEQFASTATTKAAEAAASAKTAADAAGNASTAVSAAIDPTLSVSGKAADAAKVGEAVNAEATRAKAAERQNATEISIESTRATGEERRLDAAIITETTRAERAEQALSARTDALESCGFVVVNGKVCIKYMKKS